MSLKFLINIHIGGKTYSFFPVCKSFKVVFPNLLLYNNQMIDDILSHKLICIGCGFYNNQSIHNLIVNILTRNSNIDVINVIKDCTSIDDAIEFVSELTEMNKNSEIEGLCVIVVSIKINETKFVYVLRPNYTQSQIKTCLCKMYNLKLGIITS